MTRKLVHTIKAQDVGRTVIRRDAGGFPIHVSSFMGPIQTIDVGKRIYSVGGIFQVENNEQRDHRVKAGA